MRLTCLLLATALPVAAQAPIESVTSSPIGFNKVTCPANSDTIVGVPLRKEGSHSTKLDADPVGNVLEVTATNLPIWPANTHYVKFTGGTKDGCWFPVTINTASSLTIDLNGDNLNGAISGDPVIVAEFWTLGSLFDPTLATTDPTTTGHAIVASTNTISTGRRTEVIFPNRAATGINLPVFGRYYIYGGSWKLSGGGTTNQNAVTLDPDSFLTISHPFAVTSSTTYRATGEVELGKFSIPLSTLVTGQQDNLIGLPRPVDLTLETLGLRQSSAFVASTNTISTGRKDQLLVFNNETQLRNKAPSAIYYVHGGIWKLSGGGITDRGTDPLPAGAAFIIRKAATLDGATAMWNNPAPYTNQ